VPSGLNVSGIVIVLGVFDPACSEGEFLVVLEELVAGAIGANQTTSLGVTCGRQWMIRRIIEEAYRCTIREKQASLAIIEDRSVRYIPASGQSSPTQVSIGSLTVGHRHTLIPTFRRLDNVREIVDMMGVERQLTSAGWLLIARQ
jgi:hypothetical protein